MVGGRTAHRERRPGQDVGSFDGGVHELEDNALDPRRLLAGDLPQRNIVDEDRNRPPAQCVPPMTGSDGAVARLPATMSASVWSRAIDGAQPVSSAKREALPAISGGSVARTRLGST